MLIGNFGKFRVYKFQPQRKKNKKRTAESRDIWLMFLLKSTERQAGHNRKTVVIDRFLKKNELTKKNFA